MPPAESPFIGPLPRNMAGIPRGRYALGSSECAATHCLLLDLQERQVYVASLGETEEFVRAQWPPAPPVSAEDVEALIAALRAAMEEASRERVSFRVCDACFGGWIKADDGGYDLWAGG